MVPLPWLRVTKLEWRRRGDPGGFSFLPSVVTDAEQLKPNRTLPAEATAEPTPVNTTGRRRDNTGEAPDASFTSIPPLRPRPADGTHLSPCCVGRLGGRDPPPGRGQWLRWKLIERI